MSSGDDRVVPPANGQGGIPPIGHSIGDRPVAGNPFGEEGDGPDVNERLPRGFRAARLPDGSPAIERVAPTPKHERPNLFRRVFGRRGLSEPGLDTSSNGEPDLEQVPPEPKRPHFFRRVWNWVKSPFARRPEKTLFELAQTPHGYPPNPHTPASSKKARAKRSGWIIRCGVYCYLGLIILIAVSVLAWNYWPQISERYGRVSAALWGSTTVASSPAVGSPANLAAMGDIVGKAIRAQVAPTQDAVGQLRVENRDLQAQIGKLKTSEAEMARRLGETEKKLKELETRLGQASPTIDLGAFSRALEQSLAKPGS